MVHAGQLVVSGPVSRERLQSVAGEAADAVRRVRQVWGSEVLRHTLTIQVAATDEQFRNAGGGAEEGAQIAATTTANGAVVLAPVLFTKVTAPGQVVVLTHELTHVALGQGALTGVPRWVIEGSAEFTAYAGSAKSLAVIAPQLATAVRTGSLPAGAPPDDRFVQDPVAAYQEALAWCRFLAERFGRSTFVSFVRAADAGTPRAFETAFGSSATSLRAPYAIYLHARLR